MKSTANAMDMDDNDDADYEQHSDEFVAKRHATTATPFKAVDATHTPVRAPTTHAELMRLSKDELRVLCCTDGARGGTTHEMRAALTVKFNLAPHDGVADARSTLSV
jgi:hypothetical protein